MKKQTLLHHLHHPPPVGAAIRNPAKSAGICSPLAQPEGPFGNLSAVRMGVCARGRRGGWGSVLEVRGLGMCVAMQEGARGQSFVNLVNLI